MNRKKFTFSILLMALFLLPLTLKAQVIPSDTILVSDDVFVMRLSSNNVPGYSGDFPIVGAGNGGDAWDDPNDDIDHEIGNGYKNNYSRTPFFKFDLSLLPSGENVVIDSIVFSVTPKEVQDLADMIDPPNVTNYVAHVPVEAGVSDNWNEETMYFDLAVIFWSYGVGTDGDKNLWLKEALNDTTMIGHFDVVSMDDTIVPKTVNVTEAVNAETSNYLTLSVYDRDRDPDWYTSETQVREGKRIYYRSKEDPDATKAQMPVLLVYTRDNTAVQDKYSQPGIKFYPNPAADIMTIDLSRSNTASLKIFDITGRTILSSKLTNASSKIDISSITKGYYIMVVDDGIKPLTSKFVKE